ncbi:MAG: hypothetical protein A2X53_18955 [Candidatus Rokubacteria bacterium GWA2_70_23]|nr:MAG: hypothetical protein A2X53_18955 [Candidatus Rokubacteria bacterium GWA2_70_23]
MQRVSLAMASTCRRSSQLRERFSPWKRGWSRRRSSGGRSSGVWTLPVRTPRPRGEQATNEIPRSRQTGSAASASVR